jgi:hypothetical protein
MVVVVNGGRQKGFEAKRRKGDYEELLNVF